VDISRVYWSRRTGVKAAELLRPASQNSRSSRNSFRSGALIPCAGSEQTRTAPSPPPEKAQSACSAVRAAHQPSPDDSSISTSASSGARLRSQSGCGYGCRDESAVRAGGAGVGCSRTRGRGTRELDRPEDVNASDPVRFPPGWPRLCTSPSFTGSFAVVNTTGIVCVAAFTASAVTSPPPATITLTR
jgi:hypothetical protein